MDRRPKDELRQEQVANELAESIASKYGTPFYLYDLDVVRGAAGRMRIALPSARILYAIKANPCTEVLSTLFPLVDGADIASSGELRLAREAGFAPRSLSFAGPGKTDEALALAVSEGVGFIVVESIGEMERLARIARTVGSVVQVLLRVNPAQEIRAFGLRTAGGPSPFGIPEPELGQAVSVARSHSEILRLMGVHVHAGSQCRSVSAFMEHVARTLDLAERLVRERGVRAEVVNLGGGFAVMPGDLDQAFDLSAFGHRAERAFSKLCAATGIAHRFFFEPGRLLVADAGVYVARVVEVKDSYGERFVILDGGMNHHLLATGHLGSSGQPCALTAFVPAERPLTRVTVVGPLCTPLDVFAEDVELPELRPGDLVGISRAGAYGASASPERFLGHGPAVELVMERGQVRRAQ